MEGLAETGNRRAFTARLNARRSPASSALTVERAAPEVSLFANYVTPVNADGDCAAVVALVEQLIDVLDLETRIWTRVDANEARLPSS